MECLRIAFYSLGARYDTRHLIDKIALHAQFRRGLRLGGAAYFVNQ